MSESGSNKENKDELLNDTDVDPESEIDLSREINDEELDRELDEEFGEGNNDSIIDQEHLSSLLEQKDSLVHYRIENIYVDDDKKRYIGQMKLRREPPVLIVVDENNNEAKFYLTKELNNELLRTLGEVKRAYLGFSGPKDLDRPKGIIKRIRYYVRNNPFKILTGIFLILFLISLNMQ